MEVDAHHRSASPLRLFVVIPVTVATYGLLLHWAYVALIVPKYQYQGYLYDEPNPGIVLLNWSLAAIVAMLLPRTFYKVSSLVLWLLYARVVAPILLMSPYISHVDDVEAGLLATVLAITFTIITLGLRGESRGLGMSISPTSITMVLLVLSLVTYGWIFATQGIRLQFVDLLSVYDVRGEWNENTDGSGLLHYLRSWQSSIVNPLVFILGVQSRRYLLVGSAILGQYLLYTSSGFKGTFFIIFAWILIAFLLRAREMRIGGLFIVWGMMGLVLLANIIDSLTDSTLWTSLFTRRFLVTPTMLTTVYIDFFDENPKANLAHSIFRGLIDYPYADNPSRVIGKYLGFPDMSANTNLFADGFANFGWAGVIGMGILLLITLRIVDRSAVGLPIMVSGVVLTGPAMNLSNSALLTSLLTHGLILAGVLLALIPRSGANRIVEPRHFPRDSHVGASPAD